MKDQLVKLLMERVNLDREKAEKSVDTVMDFIQDNPDKLTSLLKDDRVEEVTGKLKGLFGR